MRIKLLKVKKRSLRVPPVLMLFFLSPTIGELLSGSAPPVEFFNPIGFLLLASLYGSGAILMRELTIRWRKGCVSLLLLGAAYGIIEEGLMVKSIFDPNWPDLGFLGVFGRWMGVNWVWAEMLTIYHAVFSIAIPVLLVELAYPSRRRGRWVGNRALGGFILLLAGIVLLGFLALTPYRPPIPQYFLAVLIVVLLIFLAWKLPSDWGSHGSARLPKPVHLWAIGFLGGIGFFFIFWAVPYLLPLPSGVMLLGGSLVLGFLAFLKRLNWKEDSDLHRFALASGGLSLFILLAPLQELDTTRTDNPKGMMLVGLAFLVGLILMGWRIRRRTRSNIGKTRNMFSTFRIYSLPLKWCKQDTLSSILPCSLWIPTLFWQSA